MKEKKMLSPRQYAETVNVSHTAVMDWLKAGLLPGATMSTMAGRTYYEIPEGAPAPELKTGRPKKATTKAAPPKPPPHPPFPTNKSKAQSTLAEAKAADAVKMKAETDKRADKRVKQ